MRCGLKNGDSYTAIIFMRDLIFYPRWGIGIYSSYVLPKGHALRDQLRNWDTYANAISAPVKYRQI